MSFKTTFLYEADANENGGLDAAVNNDVNTGDQSQQKTPTADAAPVIPEDIQKELAELRAFREANKKPDEKSPEQILKEAELEKVNFRKYAVENDFAKDDDFVQYETLQQKKDADLVFENFLNDFKEENPEIEDEKELTYAAQEEFNKAYKLTSSNEKAKEKGLAKLAKEANEIRNPYISKIEKAKASYSEEKELRAKMPVFEKFIASEIEKNAPDTVSFKIKSGEEEIPVEITLTKEDKAAIAKEFNTPKTFLTYSKSQEDAEKALAKKIQGWIKVNKFEEATAQMLKIGEGRGVAKGSNAGADAPFALRQSRAKQDGKVLTLEASNNKMAEARARFN